MWDVNSILDDCGSAQVLLLTQPPELPRLEPRNGPQHLTIYRFRV
jgi:hypothetical protein